MGQAAQAAEALDQGRSRDRAQILVLGKVEQRLACGLVVGPMADEVQQGMGLCVGPGRHLLAQDVKPGRAAGPLYPGQHVTRDLAQGPAQAVHRGRHVE